MHKVENDAADDPYQSAVTSGWLNNTEADAPITLGNPVFHTEAQDHRGRRGKNH
ncbi:MAG: hypothetical protein LBU66_06530 [Treponema sp.]|nr:hypothetical protein [Treponema sp.]